MKLISSISFLCSFFSHSQIQDANLILDKISNCPSCYPDTIFYPDSLQNFKVVFYTKIDSTNDIRRGFIEYYNNSIFTYQWIEESGDISYLIELDEKGRINSQNVLVKETSVTIYYYWINGAIKKIEHYDELYCSDGWHLEFDDSGKLLSIEYYVRGLTRKELELSQGEQDKLVKRPLGTCLCNK